MCMHGKSAEGGTVLLLVKGINWIIKWLGGEGADYDKHAISIERACTDYACRSSRKELQGTVFSKEVGIDSRQRQGETCACTLYKC